MNPYEQIANRLTYAFFILMTLGLFSLAERIAIGRSFIWMLPVIFVVMLKGNRWLFSRLLKKREEHGTDVIQNSPS